MRLHPPVFMSGNLVFFIVLHKFEVRLILFVISLNLLLLLWLLTGELASPAFYLDDPTPDILSGWKQTFIDIFFHRFSGNFA